MKAQMTIIVDIIDTMLYTHTNPRQNASQLAHTGQRRNTPLTTVANS